MLLDVRVNNSTRRRTLPAGGASLSVRAHCVWRRFLRSTMNRVVMVHPPFVPSKSGPGLATQPSPRGSLPCSIAFRSEFMKTVSLPGGKSLPVLGLGTWRMGESARARQAEVAAVRCALELGYRLIDTAEMYGEGGAEEVVGQALAEAMRAGALAREEIFVVSKVYPHNASRGGTRAACEHSRKRLGL